MESEPRFVCRMDDDDLADYRNARAFYDVAVHVPNVQELGLSEVHAMIHDLYKIEDRLLAKYINGDHSHGFYAISPVTGAIHEVSSPTL